LQASRSRLSSRRARRRANPDVMCRALLFHRLARVAQSFRHVTHDVDHSRKRSAPATRRCTRTSP
jgi:hypothetical protein